MQTVEWQNNRTGQPKFSLDFLYDHYINGILMVSFGMFSLFASMVPFWDNTVCISKDYKLEILESDISVEE